MRNAGVIPPTQRGLVALYALSVAGYPLVSIIPVVFGMPSRWTSVPYRALVLGLSLVVLIPAVMRSPRFYRGVLWAPLALFIVLYLYRLYLDIVLDPIALGMPPAEFVTFGLGVTLVPMLPFFLALERRASDLALRLTLGVAVLAAILVLAVAIRQFRAGDLLALWSGRFGTETLNPISLGHLGASIAILASYRLVWQASIKGSQRAYLVGALILGLVTIAVSASRGPMLAAVVALAAAWVMPLRGRARVLMVGFTATIVLFAVGAAVRVQDQFGIPLVSRVAALSQARSDQASNLRLTYMRDAWGQFMEHPVLGSALEERNSRGYPHNVNLEAFMATGVLGGAAFLALTLAGLWASFRLLRRDPDNGWIALLFLQAFIAASTSGSLVGSAPYYAFLAAAVSAASRIDVHVVA